jgi:hypothetical protein
MNDLMAAGHGYQRAMILLAALKLGVFLALAGGACDGKVLARRVGADAGKFSILLDALAALGLVEKRGRGYRNAKPAHDFLLPGSVKSPPTARTRAGSASYARSGKDGRRGWNYPKGNPASQ